MMDFIKKNYVIITYVILSIFLEIMGLVALGYNPFIYKPWFGLTLLGITTSILVLMSSNKARYYTSTVFLFVQGAINLVLIVIFDMTGTVFDYGMFNLRSDAMGILEAIPINFLYLFIVKVQYKTPVVEQVPLLVEQAICSTSTAISGGDFNLSVDDFDSDSD